VERSSAFGSHAGPPLSAAQPAEEITPDVELKSHFVRLPLDCPGRNTMYMYGTGGMGSVGRSHGDVWAETWSRHHTDRNGVIFFQKGR